MTKSPKSNKPSEVTRAFIEAGELQRPSPPDCLMPAPETIAVLTSTEAGRRAFDLSGQIVLAYDELSPAQRLAMDEVMGCGQAVGTADDVALLKAAQRAQHEGSSFTEMFQTVTAVNGTIEMLYQMIRPTGDAPDDVNWTVVADLLDDARRRLGDVYCALSELHQFECRIEASRG